MSRKETDKDDNRKRAGEDENEDATKPEDGVENDDRKPTEGNEVVGKGTGGSEDIGEPVEPGQTDADAKSATAGSNVEGERGKCGDANDDGAPSKVRSDNLSHDNDPVRLDGEKERVSNRDDPLPDPEKDKEMEEKAKLEQEGVARRRRRRNCKNCDREKFRSCCKKASTAFVFFLLIACCESKNF